MIHSCTNFYGGAYIVFNPYSHSLKWPFNITYIAIFAKKIIKAGEIFSEENIALKRPSKGLDPIMYWEVLGQEATRDYEVDEAIE